MEKRKVGRGRLVRSVRKRRRKVVSLIAKIIVMNSSVFQYRIRDRKNKRTDWREELLD